MYLEDLWKQISGNIGVDTRFTGRYINQRDILIHILRDVTRKKYQELEILLRDYGIKLDKSQIFRIYMKNNSKKDTKMSLNQAKIDKKGQNEPKEPKSEDLGLLDDKETDLDENIEDLEE